jgi:TRAP-type C4-dicarboxylate transport system permease small subunit
VSGDPGAAAPGTTTCAPRTGFVDRFEAGFVSANRWALVVLLATMSCLVFANVCLRYLTNESIYWAEEVARHLMIWLTFIGSGLVLRHGGHIAIDNAQDAVPARVAQGLRLLIVALLAAFCAAMVWFGIGYVERTMLQTTSATQIPFGYVYAAMPLGFALMVVHLALIARGYVSRRAFPPGDGFDATTSASL